MGFYVKSGLNYYINNNFSAFHERIFESICIDVEFKAGKKNRFVNIYRPPGNHPFLSQSDQSAAFLLNLPLYYLDFPWTLLKLIFSWIVILIY